VFSPAGAFLRAYGSAELLLNPVDVAIDPKAALVYVSDSFLHQVLVFRQDDGTLVRRIGRTAGELTAAKRAAATKPVSHGKGAADPAAAEDRVDKPADKAAAQAASEARDVVANRGIDVGQFRYPSFIAVSGTGELYVTDGLNSRVQVFAQDGRFVRQVGRAGDGPGSFARPKGLALDSENHVYVVDAAFNNVQIFDDQSRLLLVFGQMGRGEGEFDLPSGMFIDARDRIYVADRANDRLMIFQYLRERGR
jgi:DNA-binding beta-propeller fold protein YncE